MRLVAVIAFLLLCLHCAHASPQWGEAEPTSHQSWYDTGTPGGLGTPVLRPGFTVKQLAARPARVSTPVAKPARRIFTTRPSVWPTTLCLKRPSGFRAPPIAC